MKLNYTEIEHFDKLERIHAKVGDVVHIMQRSLSQLYIRAESLDNPMTANIRFDAITYKHSELMQLIEYFIKGERYFDPWDRQKLNMVVVRFGWFDKHLKQLWFVPLVDIVEKFVEGTMSGSERCKFQEVLKQLSLSAKVARKYHNLFGKQYSPRAAIMEYTAVADAKADKDGIIPDGIPLPSTNYRS